MEAKKRKKVISFKDSFMKPDTIIIKGESEVLTACSFVQLTGQTKTGKTKVLMDIVASCFGKPSALGLEVNPCPDDKCVIYVNTELSTYDFHQYLIKIHELTGHKEEIPNLYFVNGLNESTSELTKIILEMCEEEHPYLVIIDGLVDLVDDFNDQKESKEGVNRITHICTKYSCGVIVTLHQNPMNKQNSHSKSRGHLGSHLEQKAIATLVTTKNEQEKSFSLNCNRIRNGVNFVTKFIFDNNTKWIKSASTTKVDIIYDELVNIISNEEINKQSKIVELLRERTQVSQSTLSRKITEYVDNGLLLKEGALKSETLTLV